jgi:hypothetical protein
VVHWHFHVRAKLGLLYFLGVKYMYRFLLLNNKSRNREDLMEDRD